MALTVTVGVSNSVVTPGMPVQVQCSVANLTAAAIKMTLLQPYVSNKGTVTTTAGGQAQDSAAAFQSGNNIPTNFTTGNTAVTIPANTTSNFSWSETFAGQIGGTATTGQGYKYVYDVFAVVNGDDNSVNTSNRASVHVIPVDTYTGSQNTATNLRDARSPFNMPVVGQMSFDSNLLTGLGMTVLMPDG